MAVVSLMLIGAVKAAAQTQFDKRKIARIGISIGGTTSDSPLVEQYRLTAGEALGPIYSAPRIRDAIEALYRTGQVDTVTVSAQVNAAGDVELLFTIKRKTQAQKVSIVLGPAEGDEVTEEELLFKLNLLTPGTAITEQTLKNNADEILVYLRERGFYGSQVVYERKPLLNENDVAVTFRVTPNTQARVEAFQINIEGYKKPLDAELLKLKLRPGEFYSRERLLADVAKVRDHLREEDYLAPELAEPRVSYDSDTNSVLITLSGKLGPVVKVVVDAEREGVGNGTQNRLLPVKREGTLDYAAIVEGERRLENHYQEKGYFFANVTSVCSVKPEVADSEGNTIVNETEFLCSFLSGEDLMGREVEVKYRVELDRRLRLTDIRIRGTDQLTADDVRTVLRSQEANLFALVPLLGYGRGYTSASMLEEDAATVRSLMAELGYRDAQVRVNQGVRPNGEDLLITFVVEEGTPTVITEVAIVGNQAIPTAELLADLPVMVGRNYSRARIRNAAKQISEYYSNQGYYDARVTTALTATADSPSGDQKNARIEFRIESEGKRVVIDRILVEGNETTRTESVLRALTLRSGEYLRAADIYTSEQNLYATDAFTRVEIRPQPAGDGADGTRLADVLVSVEEQPARLASYGGGYSTDFGLSGFFDIRHVNLRSRLWQGGARVKVSQRQQLVQFDFINPRFINDGKKRFAPFTLSIQYQRDTTVTRFFRSAFDEGTFGIVQRVDEDGNPIDEFGAPVGDPTINRLALFAETNRTISIKNRSKVFLRYRFEDVRLFNIESLLVKDLLEPDAKTRISGFGATFVRDTRRNCAIKYSLLDIIAKGDPVEPCRYSGSDPTNGSFVTADYNVSLPALGANVGFQKFQASYTYYYSFPRLKNTTIAARGIIGLASVFSNGDRFTSTDFPSLNGLLPISERFFGGGPNNLRGFDFEEAGPRVVIVPQGTFRNSDGEEVFLDPFTIPFGGNALAVVNIEGRIPVSNSIRVVPFYDGGNVFRKVGDIFKRAEVAPDDVAGQNQRAVWSHSVGLGLRIKTPVGGEFGVDYGRLLNPPVFLIPQSAGFNALYRLRQDHIHFRFSQAF